MKDKEITILFFVLCFIVLFAAGCTSEQKAGVVVPRAPKMPVLATTTLLATIGDMDEPLIDDPALGKKTYQILFNERGRGVAYIAKVGSMVHVVHNGNAGSLFPEIFNIALSPDGQRIAYVIHDKDEKSRLILDGRQGRPFDDIGRISFSPDSRHVAYKAIIKEKVFVAADENIGKGYTTYNGDPFFSADSTKVVYAEGPDGPKGERRPRLIISDLAFKHVIIKENSGDHLILNPDKTRVAAIQEVKDKRRVIDFSFDSPDLVREGPLYNAVGNLVFGWNGNSLSYAADKDGAPFLILNGKELRLPDDQMLAEPVVVKGQTGAAAIMANRQDEHSLQALYSDGSTEKQYGLISISEIAFSRDGGLHAYPAKIGEKWCLVVNGKEGPRFDAVVTPMFSPDGKMIVYRARKGGKRFVVVSDTSGKVLRQHPGTRWYSKRSLPMTGDRLRTA